MKPELKFASIGECMIELSPAAMIEDTGSTRSLLRQAYAGDTFNTATYLARQFSDVGQTAYITGLGSDMQSQNMRLKFLEEGIGVDHITLVEGKGPGLYMIENDENGERYFQYWRNDSAARKMFDGWSVEKLQHLLSSFDLVYFSGITVAIFDKAQRDVFLATLASLKGKVKIAFDSNFRPALWQDLSVCRDVFCRAAAVSDYALVGAEDHTALWQDSDPKIIAEKWRAFGAEEVIVKNGDSSCLVLNADGSCEIDPPCKLKPVDTTGAGDSFAAGYIGMRIQNKCVEQSTCMAHEIAAQVIMHHGGVIERSDWKKVKNVKG